MENYWRLYITMSYSIYFQKVLNLAFISKVVSSLRKEGKMVDFTGFKRMDFATSEDDLQIIYQEEETLMDFVNRKMTIVHTFYDDESDKIISYLISVEGKDGLYTLDLDEYGWMRIKKANVSSMIVTGV